MCHTLFCGSDSITVDQPGARGQSGGQDGGSRAIKGTGVLGEVDRETTFGELGDREEVEGEIFDQQDSGERYHFS